MRITIAKACFKRFKLWDIADENPFEHCDMFARAQILPNPLTENDLRVLLKTSDRVLKRAIKILVYTGMRPDEYYHLTWKRVILGNERFIRIERDGSWVPKCRYERNIPLSDAACKALGKHRRPDSLVMGMSEAGYKVTKSLLERRLRRALLKAGLSEHKYTLYSLRDTYATNLAIQGYEAHVIAARMGHRSIETSMKYISLAM
jgi:integrase